MEGREGISTGGFGLKQHEAVDSYFMDPPRPENPNPFPGPTTNTTVAAADSVAVTAAANTAPPFSLTMPSDGMSSDSKKRRGRPRKYNPDGTLAVTLSPMPISSSVPLTSEISPRRRGRGRGRGRSRSDRLFKKPNLLEFDSPGGGSMSLVGGGNVNLAGGGNVNVAGGGNTDFVGANFMAHVLTVNTGEDVTMKIMSFSQQGSRAICVLSATGPISNVTLRQPMTSGGTLTYEGRFEILSLTGSFMPSDNGGTRSRSGGMSVSLAGPDGRVFGGGLAGLFIAAGPVQVMVGSFIVGQEQQQLKKQKKHRIGVPSAATPPSIALIPAQDLKANYERLKPVTSTLPISFSEQNPGLTNTNTVQNYYTNSANNKKDSFPSLAADAEDDDDEEEEDEDEDEEGEEFRGDSQSDSEVPS